MPAKGIREMENGGHSVSRSSSRTIVPRPAGSERKVIRQRGELPGDHQIQLAHESRGQAPVMIPSAGWKSIMSSPHRRAASVRLRACPESVRAIARGARLGSFSGRPYRYPCSPEQASPGETRTDHPAAETYRRRCPSPENRRARRRNPLSQANAASDCNGPAENRFPWTSQILPAGSARSFVIRRRPRQCAPPQSLTARFLRAIVAEKCGVNSRAAPADPRHSP